MTIKTYDDARLPALDGKQQAALDLILKAQDLYLALLRDQVTHIPLKTFRVVKRTSLAAHRDIEQVAKLDKLITEQANILAELE